MDYIIKKRLDLQCYTTFYIAGIVDIAFFPKNKDGVAQSFKAIQNDYKLPLFILGRGSNVAIKDGKLNYAAVLSHYLNRIDIDHDNKEVIVESGVAMSFLGRFLLETHQYSCFEWVYGQPGSVGGGLFMNARAYGKEISHGVKWVEVYNYETHEYLTIQAPDCKFEPKRSLFQDKPYFIIRACFLLKKIEDGEYEQSFKAMLDKKIERTEKGQFAYPNAGSCFTNNYSFGEPSGKIIDSLNLRDLSVGGVKISEHHANFFVNTGKATLEDFKTLVSQVQKKVKAERGFDLELEVQILPKEEHDPN